MGNHTSNSTPSSTNSNNYSIAPQNNYSRKQNGRPVSNEIDEGQEFIRSEPNGWGELPSPKPSDLDNGTEFWGIPPADMERQLREKPRISHSSSSADMGKF